MFNALREEIPRDVLHFFAVEKRYSERAPTWGISPSPLWKKTQQYKVHAGAKVSSLPETVVKRNFHNHLRDHGRQSLRPKSSVVLVQPLMLEGYRTSATLWTSRVPKVQQ
jgi:hypothetical protein